MKASTRATSRGFELLPALRPILQGACAVLLALALSGCVNNAVTQFAGSLGDAILDSDDPETVRDGAPSYLLLVDALVQGAPGDPAYLALSSRLYGAYGGAFVDDPERRVRFAAKSLDLAWRALCARRADACDLRERDLPALQAWLARAKAEDVEPVYGLAVAWAGFVQANSDDWNAVADLARVRALMRWVADTEPAYDNGGAYLYLGVFEALVPAAMGGQPEQARADFERAVALSGGRYLMTKVMYARFYARGVYDRALHDRLVQEVLAADPHVHGLTLMNVMAQREARKLAADADDYF